MDPNAITTTAQAFSSVFTAADALGHLNLMQSLLYLLGGLAVILGSASASQHVLEIVYAYVKPPFWLKAFIPMAWSAMVAWMLKMSGMDAATAATAALTWHQIVDKLNDSPWAKSIEDKVIGAVQAKVAAAVLLVGLLALGAVAHADNAWDVNVGLLAGVNNSVFADGGALKPITGALAGGEVNLGYGQSTTPGQFTPAIVPLLGEVSLDTRSGSQWLNAGVGFGYVIPGTLEPVTLLLDWDLGSGQALPYLAVGYTLSFQGINFPVAWTK